MRRRHVAFVLVLGAWPVSLAAQVQVRFDLSDSVLAIPKGQSRMVRLLMDTPCSGVASYSVTLFLDRARVRLVRADSVPGSGLPAPAVDSSTADQYTLAASGGLGSYCTESLAALTFRVDSATIPGSLISLRLNSAAGYSPPSDLVAGYRADLLEICQADKVSGDVDQNLTVNSRDALIVLTRAVGLPVSGSFDWSVGDVDGDQQTTSRDALFILSAGIGLKLPPGVTAGKGIAARCAPLAPAPADLVFFSDNGMEWIPAGSTARSLIPLLYSANQASTPRWSPDGRRIAYECVAPYPYNQDICLVSPDGSNSVSLNLTSFNRDQGPDWAPDGTRIAFIRYGNGDIWLADVDGTNLVPVTSGHTVADLAWSPDGRRIAFTGYNTSTECCSLRLKLVNVDGTGLRELFPNSRSRLPANPSWSPAGDSVVYFSGADGRLYKVAASDSSGPGVPASPLSGDLAYPDWIGPGIGLRRQPPYPGSIYFHRTADGRQLRITRGTGFNGDQRPDFRRTGGVYVDTVTVTPKLDSLSLSRAGGLPDSVVLAARVVNSDGSASGIPVRWISRNPAVVSVASLDSARAVVRGVSVDTVGVYVIGTVRGWRQDSALVKVKR